MTHPHNDAGPSAWVERWAAMIRPGGIVLDVAAWATAATPGSWRCKTTDEKRPPPAPSPPPSVPAPKPEARRQELIDTLLLNEPQFANATALAPLKVVEDREQAVQSWCMTGSDARRSPAL